MLSRQLSDARSSRASVARQHPRMAQDWRALREPQKHRAVRGARRSAEHQSKERTKRSRNCVAGDAPAETLFEAEVARRRPGHAEQQGQRRKTQAYFAQLVDRPTICSAWASPVASSSWTSPAMHSSACLLCGHRRRTVLGALFQRGRLRRPVLGPSFGPSPAHTRNPILGLSVGYVTRSATRGPRRRCRNTSDPPVWCSRPHPSEFGSI